MNSGFLSGAEHFCWARTILSGVSIAAVMASGFSTISGQYAFAQSSPDPSQGLSLSDISQTPQNMTVNEDIYLNVIVNGEMREDMYAFRQKENGDFIIKEDDLKAIGLASAKSARFKDNWVDISALPDVISAYDSKQEAIEFITSSQNALVPYTVSVNPWAEQAKRRNNEEEGQPRSDLAAVVNYGFYASSGAKDIKDALNFKGVSGNLEGRISGQFGTFNSGHLVTYSSKADDVYKSVRLESYWSYSDPRKLYTYRAGDVVSRSLPWSRSVRLGGFQIRRNFTLRSDLVIMPLPSFSGSAAVPSAVDIYINNAKRATENIPVGPFSLTDMPIVSGGNKARLVVRDAQGRETVTEMSFFGSSDMLAQGLLDFSVEAGLPRQYYGSRSDNYDNRLFVSATARYGLSNNLTLEGHAEIGGKFFNGGVGTTFTLWDFGALSLAASGSSYKGRSGQQLAAGLQLQKWGFSLSARTQRTYNDYDDIASVTAERLRDRDYIKDWNPDNSFPDNFDRAPDLNIRPAKTINQISFGIPLHFDPTSLNFTYTEVKNHDGDDSRYLGFSLSRSFDQKAYGYINGFQDLRRSNSYSIFAGLTISLDDRHSVSYDVNNDHNGTNFTSRLRRQMGGEIGDYGWTLRDIEGNRKQRGASGSYRTPFAVAAGSIEQYENSYQATADINGAVVLAGGSVIPSNSIYDSFAVVDTGTPNVSVYYQNSYYGKTGWNGKLVIPKLVSYRENRLSIDMETLPLDTLVTETDVLVTPAYQSGIVENFGGVGKSDYILVSLKDESGAFIELGSYAGVVGSDQGFDVAYDGMGVLPTKRLKYPARIMVERPDNRFCQAILNSYDKSSVTSGALVLTCVPVSEKAAVR